MRLRPLRVHEAHTRKLATEMAQTASILALKSQAPSSPASLHLLKAPFVRGNDVGGDIV